MPSESPLRGQHRCPNQTVIFGYYSFGCLAGQHQVYIAKTASRQLLYLYLPLTSLILYVPILRIHVVMINAEPVIRRMSPHVEGMRAIHLLARQFPVL